jgi:hypothetical protein
MPGRHRGASRPLLEGVERLGDFTATGYRSRRPKGEIKATPDTQDRVAIRSDFEALHRGLIEGIMAVSAEANLTATLTNPQAVLLDWINQPGVLDAVIRRIDPQGRTWYTKLKSSEDLTEEPAIWDSLSELYGLLTAQYEAQLSTAKSWTYDGLQEAVDSAGELPSSTDPDRDGWADQDGHDE